MRYLALAAGGMLLLILLLGYVLLRLPGSDLADPILGIIPLRISPEGAVRQSEDPCGTLGDERGGFRVLGGRRSPGGVNVVFHSAVCPRSVFDEPGSPQEFFGYSVVRRDGLLWEDEIGTLIGPDEEFPPPNPDALVAYFSSDPEHGESLAMVYGRILVPQVRAVEVSFDDGRTLRGGGENEVFAVFPREGAQACEVRALSASGQILQVQYARADLLDCPSEAITPLDPATGEPRIP